jgi:hypothetical protein
VRAGQPPYNGLSDKEKQSLLDAFKKDFVDDQVRVRVWG